MKRIRKIIIISLTVLMVCMNMPDCHEACLGRRHTMLLRVPMGKIGTAETMTKRRFLEKAAKWGAGIGLLPFVFRGDSEIKKERIPESITEKIIHSPEDLRVLENITRELEISIKNYYREVIRLSKQKEELDYNNILMRTVVPIAANILNKYISIPQIQEEIMKIPPNELYNLSLEQCVDIFAGYYASFGKYFNMVRISDNFNGKFVPGLYNFILADIAEVSDGSELTYLDKKPQVKEITLRRVRIEFLVKSSAWADSQNSTIFYNLDEFTESAEEAWKLVNQYPDILTLDKIIELIKQDMQEELSYRAFASLYLKEFGENTTKEDFINEFIKAQRVAAGLHELTHLISDKEDSSKYSAPLLSVQREFDSYWKTLGYSGYQYLAIANLLEATIMKSDTLFKDFERPHFIACNEAINHIIAYAKIRPTAISTAEPPGFSASQLGLFYASQLNLLTREQITEIGRTQVKLQYDERFYRDYNKRSSI